MPLTCTVPGCTSRKDKCPEKKFFRFPEDKARKEKWISAIGRKNWHPTEYTRICSDHFMTGMFLTLGRQLETGNIKIISKVDK